MNPQTFFINQKTQQFESAVRSWVSQVRAQRGFEATLRASLHAPNADSIIRSLPSTRQPLNRAKMELEQLLKTRLQEGYPKERQADLYRMACGHWPSIARALDPRT